MRFDDSLAALALTLADGSDIHDVAGMVAVYRAVAKEGCNVADLERELHRYVVRKRLQRAHLFRMRAK